MSQVTKKFVIAFSIIFLFLLNFNFVFATGITSPIGTEDPRVVIGNVIKAALGLVGSLALATFILGGFFWITSAGSDEKIKRGKDMIMWATFGLAVIFFSYAMVTFVIGAVAGNSGAGGASGALTPNASGSFSPDARP